MVSRLGMAGSGRLGMMNMVFYTITTIWSSIGARPYIFHANFKWMKYFHLAWSNKQSMLDLLIPKYNENTQKLLNISMV